MRNSVLWVKVFLYYQLLRVKTILYFVLMKKLKKLEASNLYHRLLSVNCYLYKVQI